MNVPILRFRLAIRNAPLPFTKDFDDTARVLESAGGVGAMHCWQGYFIDTEGNTFGIFQPDSAAK